MNPIAPAVRRSQIGGWMECACRLALLNWRKQPWSSFFSGGSFISDLTIQPGTFKAGNPTKRSRISRVKARLFSYSLTTATTSGIMSTGRYTVWDGWLHISSERCFAAVRLMRNMRRVIFSGVSLPSSQWENAKKQSSAECRGNPAFCATYSTFSNKKHLTKALLSDII